MSGAPIATQAGNAYRMSERLFVALPLPEEVAAALARMEPTAGDAVRPISAVDMHLTLHFLGRAVTDVVRDALRSVTAAEFDVCLGRPGHFSMKGRKQVLWVGVEPTSPLLALHAALGEALGTAGFEPETRPYVPHITVARLGAKAPRRLVRDFEQQPIPAEPVTFKATRFALFASETAAEGARYRVLESFALEPSPRGADP
jgi:2'-5' RNA ligase